MVLKPQGALIALFRVVSKVSSPSYVSINIVAACPLRYRPNGLSLMLEAGAGIEPRDPELMKLSICH